MSHDGKSIARRLDDGERIRARIIDSAGVAYGPLAVTLAVLTPDPTWPHVGKQGWAARAPDGSCQIDLDDGAVIHGRDCWWEPVT